MTDKRPRVRISFKYNRVTGEIEEFIVDDQARTASEAYHTATAAAVARLLGRHPEIEDAGPIHLTRIEPEVVFPSEPATPASDAAPEGQE